MLQSIRARSAENKAERRDDILRAGLALWREERWSAITMNEVARRAGIAKGTLYLYFPTKEELFLQLLENLLDAWFDAIDRKLDAARAPWDAVRFAHVVTGTLDGRSDLVRMLAVLGTILEHNISLERAIAFKQFILGRMLATAERMTGVLPGIGTKRAARLLLHIHALVTGLAGMAHPAPVMTEALATPGMEIFSVDLERELQFILRALVRDLIHD